MTGLPASLVPWRPILTGLRPELIELLSGWMPRLSVALEPMEPQPDTGEGEPDGYDGLTRRGPWERLVPSVWALADAAPDEFLRRAAERELPFWRLAHRQPKRGWQGVIWLDVGPEIVGAPRLLGLAAAVVLAERIRLAGGEPVALWSGPGGDGLADPLDLGALRAWLQTRTRRQPTVADLVGLGSRWSLDPTRDRLWAVGGPTLAGIASRAGHDAIAVTEALDARALRVEVHQRRRRALQLPLPGDRTVAQLIRDPLAPPPNPMGDALSDISLTWSPTGSRLFVVRGRTAWVYEANPLVRGRRRHRTYRAPDPIVGVTFHARKAVFLLRQGPILRFWFPHETSGAWRGAPPGVPAPPELVVRGVSRLFLLPDPRRGEDGAPTVPRAAAMLRDSHGTLWLIDVLNGVCTPVLRDLVGALVLPSFDPKAQNLPRRLFAQRLDGGGGRVLEWLPTRPAPSLAPSAAPGAQILGPTPLAFLGPRYGDGPVPSLSDQSYRVVSRLDLEPARMVLGASAQSPVVVMDRQGAWQGLGGRWDAASWEAGAIQAPVPEIEVDALVRGGSEGDHLALDATRHNLVRAGRFVTKVETPLRAPWLTHALQPRHHHLVGLDERGHLIVLDPAEHAVIEDLLLPLEDA